MRVLPPPIGKTNPQARQLRRSSTDAEKLLWQHLRNRQLAGMKFRRQVTIGPFIADFACVERKLVVEAGGGQHSAERDAARTAYLRERGYRVLRYWNNDILQNLEGVLISIMQNAEEGPSPNPVPLAGEG